MFPLNTLVSREKGKVDGGGEGRRRQEIIANEWGVAEERRVGGEVLQ